MGILVCQLNNPPWYKWFNSIGHGFPSYTTLSIQSIRSAGFPTIAPLPTKKNCSCITPQLRVPVALAPNRCGLTAVVIPCHMQKGNVDPPNGSCGLPVSNDN